MSNGIRDLLRHYRVTLVVMCMLAVIALWPTLLAPLGRMYVVLCGRLLADAPFGHHYPPLLVAFIAPVAVTLLAGCVVAGTREILGQRRLSAALSARRWFPGEAGSTTTEALIGSPDVIVTADDEVYAFCSGLFRPRVYLSRGVLRILDKDEVDALLCHERHHLRRRDPSRFFLTGLLRGLAPVLPALMTLDQWVRVRAELEADRAVLANQSPEVLASTLLKVMRAVPTTDHALIVAGLSPTDARVAALLGKPVSMDVDRDDLVLSLLMLVEYCAVAVWLAYQSLPNPPLCTACPAF